MCTRAMWTTRDGAVLVGRNMDWVQDTATNLWALPAGIQRDGLVPGGLSWTSRFGSVVAAAYDIASTDGINTAGLGAHLLWLTEADYGERDAARPALAPSIWLQYVLDCFATVAEAVAAMQSTDLQLVPQVEPFSGQDIAVHLVLDDAGGDSAVLEVVGGRLEVHHDSGYRVATNSPPYAQQFEHLRTFTGFGGDAPLPGTTAAPDRFVRASYYVERLPQPDSDRAAVASILSVMRNAAQPFGTSDPARPYISSTVWRTVAHLTAGLYFFESSFRPSISWVRVGDLDLSAGQPVRLLALAGEEDLGGDLTEAFAPSEPFAFAVP